MSARKNNPSLEGILDSFAMEPNPSGEVLGRYLADFPQFAEDLVDLSQEMFQVGLVQDRELTSLDSNRISSAWSVLQASLGQPLADPLASLSQQVMGDLSEVLQVPRQVILAFWERRVLPASVPRQFLNRMASALDASAKSLNESLALPKQALARSHKADEKPTSDADKQAFEQVLRDAKVPEDQIAALLTEGA